MSKSAGTFIILNNLIEEGINPLAYRYFCLNAHYRTPLTFLIDAVKAAENSYKNLLSKIIALKKENTDNGDITKYEEDFHNAINNDLNIPVALSILHILLKDNNLGSKQKLELVEKFDSVFGLKLMDAEEEIIDIPQEIIDLAEQRRKARDNKDWATADRFRTEIESKGFTVEDSVEGFKIRKL